MAHGQWNQGEVMVALLSSQTGWIENSMVAKIGEQAYELSGFLKIKELSFYEITTYFREYKMEDSIEIYAVLGGNYGLWRYFNERMSAKQNIIANILSPQSFLHRHGERIVAEELRETGIYNTILAAIAAGHNRLNNLYRHTGFSRAKISVYLKNLMELELVEKLFSFNTKKGYYRITNHFVHFYFTYLYPHLSDLSYLRADEFYSAYIEPTFKSYVTGYFRLVCIAKLAYWNKMGSLPLSLGQSDEWVGKDGTIDIIAHDDEGKTLLGLCNWEKPLMTYEDYEWLLFCADKAGLKADFIYLFSGGRFDEKLSLEAKVKPNIRLIGADDL
jgi:AAA+ ATPase superfamily predicted ATPase